MHKNEYIFWLDREVIREVESQYAFICGNMHEDYDGYAVLLLKYSYFLNKIWIYAEMFVILHPETE